MRLSMVIVQEEKDGEWIPGIMINDGDKIIYSSGKVEPINVWDYKTLEEFFSIDLSPTFKFIYDSLLKEKLDKSIDSDE